MIRLIYLAAPLSSPDERTRCDHMHAAQQLRDALEADLRAMVYLPHERIARRYGYPAHEETAQEWLQAMTECLTALRMIRDAGGALHVLARPDGTLSLGCAAEVDHWREIGGAEPIVWRAHEAGWTSADGRYGMGR